MASIDIQPGPVCRLLDSFGIKAPLDDHSMWSPPRQGFSLRTAPE
jgi:hypothetical protein